MSAGKDESASPSLASPKFARPSASTSALREPTIPESPENEEVPTPPPAAVPPQVPRRNRAMSSAHLSHFLGSTASAARRSLVPKPTPITSPQFLTVSSAFTVRDGSRSPSPAVPVSARAGARHSIDVRNFPSYLQRKRTSLTLGAGKILHDLAEAATSPFEPSSPEQLKPLNEPFYEEPEAPVLSLGERVAWIAAGGAVLPEFGIVKWIGRMPQVCRAWTVGVEFDNAIGSGDGRLGGRRYFTAKENFAKFLPLAALTRVDHYAGRPRSGTLLSRMSVQLKPGQLISVQRTPSIHHLAHCALNAPHHVDHDVHAPNMEHCLCHNCNHPCAHLCKTTKPKGKKGKKDIKIAHMCHFSHKPHGKLCCGGEDLLYESITSPKASIPADTLCESQYVANRRQSDHSSCRCKASKSETRQSRKKSAGSSRRSSSVPADAGQGEEVCESQGDGSAPAEESAVERVGTRSRSGSELSIASLPSTTSPVDVFIARGALTDESDVEFDLVHSIAARTPSELSFAERGRVSGGLRSLVSCLVPGISYQKTSGSRSHRKRTRKGKPPHSLNNQICTAVSMEFSDNFKDHHFSGSVYSTRSNSGSRSCKYKGLSTSPEDLDTGRNSSTNSRNQATLRNPCTSNDSNHNKINTFLLANDNLIVSCAPLSEPDFLTEIEIEHKSPASTMTGTPESDKKSGVRGSSPTADHRDSGVWSKVSTTASILQVDLEVIAEAERRLPIWKDDGSTGGRSPCQHQGQGRSEPSSAAGSGKKGRAPRPPAALCPNSASNSPSHVLSFTSASFSPTCRKRKSLKTRPAPSPPPPDTRTGLTRSLSEQRQLNVKNCLNAVPSFRSEVNLKAVPRHQHSGDTTATEEGDTLYISFDEDDGEKQETACTCCDERVPAAMAERLDDEFLSPPLSPPLSLPLPPPPEHGDYFDDSGWHRDVSVQVSGFPSPPSDYVHQRVRDESGDEDEEYGEEETEDEDEDSSADVTVNYECDDLVGHSHSLVVCTACGCHLPCHLFRGDVSGQTHPSPYFPPAGKYDNDNDHGDNGVRDALTNQSQPNRPARLYGESEGMSRHQWTGQRHSACNCPSSCRYRNSYRRTFSLQFPVRASVEPLHDPAASNPSGRQEEDQAQETTVRRSSEKSADQNLFSPRDVDLAAVSQNLKALLSPHRDWIRCSMCRTEVCWLAASTTMPIRRPVIAFTLLLILIAALILYPLI